VHDGVRATRSHPLHIQVHIFLPVRLNRPQAEEIVRPRRGQLHDGIGYVQSAIDHVELETSEVHLDDGSTLGYDVLVVVA
jgi:sulfide:quinone oxidoreductase